MTPPRSAAALCLTGGGYRGRFTLEILAEFERRRRRATGRSHPAAGLGFAFDLIAGTSAGALIAAGLAAGIAVDDLIGLFDKHASRIFPSGRLRVLRQVVRAKYPIAPLAAAVEDALGGTDTRFRDLRHPLLVPVLDEQAGKPVIYSGLDPDTADLPVAPVVLASAAAPTYFPAVRIGGRRHVDGGLFANAPDLAAIAHLRRFRPGLPLSGIRVLSVGTTRVAAIGSTDQADGGDWGLAAWASRPAAHLLKLTLAAQSEFTDDAMPRLGLGAYLRIDATLAAGAVGELDDASPAARDALVAAARARLDRIYQPPESGEARELEAVLRRMR